MVSALCGSIQTSFLAESLRVQQAGCPLRECLARAAARVFAAQVVGMLLFVGATAVAVKTGLPSRATGSEEKLFEGGTPEDELPPAKHTHAVGTMRRLLVPMQRLCTKLTGLVSAHTIAKGMAALAWGADCYAIGATTLAVDISPS